MQDGNASRPVPSDCSGYSTPTAVFVWCFAVKALLLLPLCLSVLHVGLQQRRRTSNHTFNHADSFTFHMVALELAGILGTALHVGGFYGGSERLVTAALVLSTVNLPGELLVLALTCVDRYLAVVRPVTYLRLRSGQGVVIRNVSMVAVWTVSCVFIGLTLLHHPSPPAVEFLCLLTVSLLVVSFCSATVLRALIRPGNGGRVDLSKRRAFKVVLTVMCVQMFWLLGLLTCLSAQKVQQLSPEQRCLVSASVSWFNIPCSLVLPALFLQKKRRG